MKVAWFQGDVQEPEDAGPPYLAWQSQEQLLALPSDDPHAPCLRVLLVPDDADTSGLWGDDWDDAPASSNAGPPYERTYPPGAVMLTLHVGDVINVGLPERV